MREKLQRFMYGRYGSDKLNHVLSIVALILVLLGSFFRRMSLAYWLGFALLILIYYRMMSRNIQKRYAENQAFLRYYNQWTGWFHGRKNAAARNKDYKIFRCPKCSQKVRVPKGKGKISIHCPKCGHDFIKRS